MKEVSSGGIITRRMRNNIYVLLVEHKQNTFVFPKGHVLRGESFKDAAKREIIEETGISDIKIMNQLGIINRSSEKPDGTIVRKDIRMFRVHVKNYTHNTESEETVRWFKIAEVENKLRYQEDRFFFSKIKANLT